MHSITITFPESQRQLPRRPPDCLSCHVVTEADYEFLLLGGEREQLAGCKPEVGFLVGQTLAIKAYACSWLLMTQEFGHSKTSRSLTGLSCWTREA